VLIAGGLKFHEVVYFNVSSGSQFSQGMGQAFPQTSVLKRLAKDKSALATARQSGSLWIVHY
jgi:hypothetical protein